jgi:transcriptional/translational regulatory protein YebC/TACO1
MLTLIDAGAEDIEESSDEFELYVPVNKAAEVKEKIASMGFTISSFELVQKPKNFQHITDPSLLSRILKLLDTINQHDDVQNVYSNLDAPQDLMVE